MGFGKSFQKFFSGTEASPLQDSQDFDHSNERRSRQRSLSTSSWRWKRSSSRSYSHLPGIQSDKIAPKLSPHSKNFDAKITSASLSQILIWYMHYDIACVPEKACKWYDHLPRDVMLSWIRLGYELEHGVPKGCSPLPSKGLKKACNEMSVEVDEALRRLVRLSDRTKMLTSELEVFQSQNSTGYKAATEKLNADRMLAESLRPIPGTVFERWRGKILKQIQAYMEIILLPVVRVGDFELPASKNKADLNHRNATRTLWARFAASRPRPPPEGIYTQALLDMGKAKQLPFLDRSRPSSSIPLTRAADGGKIPAKGVDSRVESCGQWRMSAPNLDEYIPMMQKFIDEAAEIRDQLNQLRLQQDQDDLEWGLESMPSTLDKHRTHSLGTPFSQRHRHSSGNLEQQLAHISNSYGFSNVKSFSLVNGQDSSPSLDQESPNPSALQETESQSTTSRQAHYGSSHVRRTQTRRYPNTAQCMPCPVNTKLSVRPSPDSDMRVDLAVGMDSTIANQYGHMPGLFSFMTANVDDAISSTDMSNHSRKSSLQLSNGNNAPQDDSSLKCTVQDLDDNERPQVYRPHHAKSVMIPSCLNQHEASPHALSSRLPPCACPEHTISTGNGSVFQTQDVNFLGGPFKLTNLDALASSGSSFEAHTLSRRQMSDIPEPYGGYNPFEETETDARKLDQHLSYQLHNTVEASSKSCPSTAEDDEDEDEDKEVSHRLPLSMIARGRSRSSSQNTLRVSSQNSSSRDPEQQEVFTRSSSTRSGSFMFHTPPTSPQPSISSLRTQGSAEGNEGKSKTIAETSELNMYPTTFMPTRRFDIRRKRSVASTVGGSSDVTDPGDLRRAVIVRTKHALESVRMVNIE